MTPHRALILLATLAALLLAIPSAELSADEKKATEKTAQHKAVEKEMLTISKLIDKGKFKDAIQKATDLGQGTPCHLPHNVFAIPRVQPDDLTKLPAKPFSYFANLGVALRKEKQYDQAALCVRMSANWTSNLQQNSAVLYEATQILPHLTKAGVTTLVGFDFFQSTTNETCADHSCEDVGLDNISCPFLTHYRLGILGIVPSTHSKKPEHQEVFRNALLATISDPQKSADEQQKAFQQRKELLADDYALRAFTVMPTPAHANRLRQRKVLTQPQIEQIVLHGFDAVHSTTTYPTRPKAIEAIDRATFEREKSSRAQLCENVRKAHKRAPKNSTAEKLSTDCLEYSLKSIAHREVSGGTYELIHAIAAKSHVGTRCFTDDGLAYLTFTDHKTKKVTLIQLPDRVGTSRSCGPADYDDFSIINISKPSPTSRTVQINVGGGAVVRLGCGLPRAENQMQSSGTTLWCQADDQAKITCLTTKFQTTNNTLRNFPTLNQTKTDQLEPKYDSVTRNVWAPLAPLLTGSVQDIAKNLPTIREKLREAYRPQ